MTKTIRAHFDGRVIVPDEPVDIPVNEPIQVMVVLPDPTVAVTPEERRAAIERLLARPIQGLNLSDSALSRESIYGDDEQSE